MDIILFTIEVCGFYGHHLKTDKFAVSAEIAQMYMKQYLSDFMCSVVSHETVDELFDNEYGEFCNNVYQYNITVDKIKAITELIK